MQRGTRRIFYEITKPGFLVQNYWRRVGVPFLGTLLYHGSKAPTKCLPCPQAYPLLRKVCPGLLDEDAGIRFFGIKFFSSLLKSDHAPRQVSVVTDITGVQAWSLQMPPYGRGKGLAPCHAALGKVYSLSFSSQFFCLSHLQVLPVTHLPQFCPTFPGNVHMDEDQNCHSHWSVWAASGVCQFPVSSPRAQRPLWACLCHLSSCTTHLFFPTQCVQSCTPRTEPCASCVPGRALDWEKLSQTLPVTWNKQRATWKSRALGNVWHPWGGEATSECQHLFLCVTEEQKQPGKIPATFVRGFRWVKNPSWIMSPQLLTDLKQQNWTTSSLSPARQNICQPASENNLLSALHTRHKGL